MTLLSYAEQDMTRTRLAGKMLETRGESKDRVKPFQDRYMKARKLVAADGGLLPWNPKLLQERLP